MAIVILALLMTFVAHTIAQTTEEILAKAQSDTFDWAHINVDIEIKENGDLLISEEQKYSFRTGHSDKWHPRYRWFLMDTLDDIKDVQVYELARSGQRLPEPAGLRHDIQTKQGQFWIWWWHELNAPETHTFLLKYRVIGGLHINKSTDELYWKAIAKNKPAQVAKARVRVRLPQQLHGKTHASLGSEIRGGRRVTVILARIETSQDGSTVEFNSTWPIPRRTGLEVRVSFPHGILNVEKPKWQGLLARVKARMWPKRWRDVPVALLILLLYLASGIMIIRALITGDWGHGGRGGGGCGGGGGGGGGGGCGGGG